MEIPIELDFGIDALGDYDLTMNELAANLDVKNPNRYKVVDRAEDVRRYYKYSLEGIYAENECARINEYLYAQAENNTDHTIPIELLKWYTTCKLYMHELKKEVNNIFDNYTKDIKNQQYNICAAIKQKRRNFEANELQHQQDTQQETSVLEKINNLPSELVAQIAQYAFTSTTKIAIYKKTHQEIENLVKITKLQLLERFKKIIKDRANPIITAFDRKPTPKKSIIKPADYEPLKHITGTTKTQITQTIIKTIDCYNYLYSITQHYSTHRTITTVIESELLYMYKTITYIARPEFNKRSKSTTPNFTIITAATTA
jgi:hypothetical protein